MIDTPEKRKVFKEIIEKYDGDIKSAVYKKISNHQAHEDVIANIYLSIWQSLDNFGGRSSLKTFIYTITARRIIDYYRKKFRITKTITEIAKSMNEEEERKWEFYKVNYLTPREMEIFKWLSMGYTNDQIKTELKISVNSVRTMTKKIYKKTGIRGRCNLILFAHKWVQREYFK
jgi:RNA polymerase sigma factor (sigma-70 family)